MRVFLDTDAASQLGRMEPDEKARLRRYVEARFAWCVSPLTFAELSLGRSRGHDWARSTLGLHELLEPADAPDCLPFPSRAVQLAITGAARSHYGWEPKDLQAYLTAAARAASRADLKSHEFDPALVALLEAGERAQRERLKEPRDGYAARVASTCGIEPSPEHLAAILKATDAAMRLDGALWSEARAAKRQPVQKNMDDWVDGQQLLLLALPDVHFLTGDERLRKRLVGCSQYHRVLSFEKTLTAASRQP